MPKTDRQHLNDCQQNKMADHKIKRNAFLEYISLIAVRFQSHPASLTHTCDPARPQSCECGYYLTKKKYLSTYRSPQYCNLKTALSQVQFYFIPQTAV